MGCPFWWEPILKRMNRADLFQVTSITDNGTTLDYKNSQRSWECRR